MPHGFKGVRLGFGQTQKFEGLQGVSGGSEEQAPWMAWVYLHLWDGSCHYPIPGYGWEVGVLFCVCCEDMHGMLGVNQVFHPSSSRQQHK